jgi:hypothetical protein
VTVDDFLDPATVHRLERLPLELAGRASDTLRQMVVSDAAVAEWDNLVSWLSDEAAAGKVPLTADERDLLARGLAWIGEPADRLDRATIVGPAELAAAAGRFRFEPARPAGDAVESHLVEFARRYPAVRALLTATRLGPDDDPRARVYCLVLASGERWLWWQAIAEVQTKVLSGSSPAASGVVIEAVVEGESLPAYHQRLVGAGAPLWVADGFDIAELLGLQGEPFVLARLPDDALLFPGLPDVDAVDSVVAGWAAHADHVEAAVRAWAQPAEEGEDHRTRVYGLLVDAPSAVAPARDAAVGVIRRTTGGEVAVEAVVPRADLPPHLARLFDVGVVLWERDGS